MKQQSSIPISRSLADFFLRRELSLSGDISVSDIQRKDDFVEVSLVQAKDPLAGSLVLIFTEQPLQIRKWRIVDAQGLTTEVELSDAEFGVPLGNEIFHYYDPSHSEQPFGINK
jgi:outer membrane lipoprotein-sorting protein